MTVLHRVRHVVRRVAQTRTAFDNPWSVIANTVAGNLHSGARDVRFQVRGLTVVAPARQGAVFPIYEVFAEDTYRMERLTAGLPRQARVLDIGAHVGSFSIAMALAVPDAQIWAYEASPTTADYLRATVDASHLQDRIHVHAEALAATAGTITLNDAGICSPLSSTTKHAGGTAVSVPAVTLADAFARCDGPVDVVKIDAEGVEYDLLLLSDASLWGSVSRVVLEYHEVEGRSPEDIVGRLGELGLSVTAREVMVGNPREGLIWFARTQTTDSQDG
jgi:FkbM family methyltransferase